MIGDWLVGTLTVGIETCMSLNPVHGYSSTNTAGFTLPLCLWTPSHQTPARLLVLHCTLCGLTSQTRSTLNSITSSLVFISACFFSLLRMVSCLLRNLSSVASSSSTLLPDLSPHCMALWVAWREVCVCVCACACACVCV